MNLHFKRRALRHLESIHRHIASDNPAAAKRVIDQIEHSIGRLQTMPFSARPGVVKGTWLLAVPGLPYIVVHRVRGDTVEIIAVLHTARERRS